MPDTKPHADSTPALVRKHAEFRSSENSGYDLRKIILKEVSEAELNQDEIKLEVKSKPIVENDESFANLATRIVDEVIANKSPEQNSIAFSTGCK